MLAPIARRPLAAAALLSLLAGTAAASPKMPPHRFHKLVERTRPALVRLVSAPGGTAVLIGVGGELLAPDHLIGDEPVLVELAGQRHDARVVERDRALGLALLALPPGQYPAATVGSASALARGGWLLGLWFDARGRLKSSPARFEQPGREPDRLRTDFRGPPGSALFNARGQLIGVRVGPRATVLSIDAARARFAPARPQ